MVYDVIIDVNLLDNHRHKVAILTHLSEILDISMSDLESYFAKDFDGSLIRPTHYQIIARSIPGTKATQIRELRLRHVHMEDKSQRVYTDPHLAPQTIGFLRGDSIWGMESFYNADLMGEAGRTIRAYDRDNNMVTESILPVNGYTLITTLDSGIQRIAQAAVDSAVLTTPCEFVGILVMEPYTGEILAMAQWPSFSLTEPSNPDYFTNRRLRTYWDALSEEQRLNEMYKLWGNYHTTRTFEPGSIFKPVVVAAAIEENVINTRTDIFHCNASVTIFGERIPCWFQHGHNNQDTVAVLANSCNIAMIEIIGKLGRERFYRYRNDFGFGERTGIDLPGEQSVSSPAVMYTLSQLNPVELATSAIGQGFNNTAIQAITAFSAVINGGNVMQPYMVSQIVDENNHIIKENTPTIVRKVISGETSAFMREAMHYAVLPGGTAFRNGYIEGYTIGGKTGSGQQGRDRDRMTVSYIAYAPVENPEFIILGVLDNLNDPSLTSGNTVVPMVREAMENIFRYKNMQPRADEGIAPQRALNRNDNTLADYSGMYLAQVSRTLNNLGIDYEVIGSGTIIGSHIPAAGQPIPINNKLNIYMDASTIIDGEMTVVPYVVGLSMEEGERIINDALLTPVAFIEKDADTTDYFGGDPVTRYPTPVEDEDTPSPVLPSSITSQYPSANSVIQRGTQVKIKVKMN
jgi:stage V sporulation protein D (sporulation-specific penicillin-binding protein)